MKEKLQRISYIAPTVEILCVRVEHGFQNSSTPNPSSASTTLLDDDSWD